MKQLSSPTPSLFEDQTPRAQLLVGLIVPCVFGAICGLALGWSAAAYWALQAVAAIGGFLGGMEHRGPGSGAQRGLAGGLLFGSFLLLAHAIAGADPSVSLGEQPGFLVVITGLMGCLIGSLGGWVRARRDRSADVA